MQREPFKQIRELLGLPVALEGASGSVYAEQVNDVAARIGVPYVERVKTWQGILRVLDVMPTSEHTSSGGTITDPGFEAVLARLEEIAESHGSIPDPVTDFLKRPTHLFLRWDPSKNPNTVDDHRTVAETKGSVWWGKVGKPSTTAISADNLQLLQHQLDVEIATYAFLYRAGELWRTEIVAVTTDESTVDKELVPAYYSAQTHTHHLWLRLTNFERLPAPFAQDRLVFATDARPLGFSGQTSMYLVKVADELKVKEERYFLFSVGAGEHQDKYGDSLGQQLGFDDDVTGRVPLLEAQTGRFIYYRTSKGNHPHPSSFIGQGRITSVDSIEPSDGKQRWVANLADYKPFEHPVPRATYSPPGWNIQHGISEVSREEFAKIMTLAKAPETLVDFTAAELRERVVNAGLILEPSVIDSLVAAVVSGKHVILTGPPGTAKTTLAEITAALAEDAGLAAGFTLTTATADWTTYETIGGLRPREDGSGLEFRDGHFLSAARHNRWLVVDELNRSNFDRAFGQLFTVLSGQSVTLPYEDAESGKPIVLKLGNQSDTSDTVGHSVVNVSPDWRIIATMNVFDKSLLFEMSFALMRRFAFIEVPAPSDDTYRTLWKGTLVSQPGNHELVQSVLSDLLHLREVKEIGPAVFLDMAKFAAHLTDINPHVTSSELAYQLFYSYLLPQFEGVDQPTGVQLLGVTRKAVGNDQAERLRTTLNDVLGLALAAPSIATTFDEELGSDDYEEALDQDETLE